MMRHLPLVAIVSKIIHLGDRCLSRRTIYRPFSRWFHGLNRVSRRKDPSIETSWSCRARFGRRRCGNRTAEGEPMTERVKAKWRWDLWSRGVDAALTMCSARARDSSSSVAQLARRQRRDARGQPAAERATDPHQPPGIAAGDQDHQQGEEHHADFAPRPE